MQVTYHWFYAIPVSETWLIDGIFAWKWGCMGNSELKKIGVHRYLKAKHLTKGNAKIRKTYCSMDIFTCIYFLRSMCKKLCILKLCREIGESFEESLQRGKLVYPLTGLSLRARGWGFPWRKQGSKEVIAVCFPAYTLYLASNLKS